MGKKHASQYANFGSLHKSAGRGYELLSWMIIPFLFPLFMLAYGNYFLLRADRECLLDLVSAAVCS